LHHFNQLQMLLADELSLDVVLEHGATSVVGLCVQEEEVLF
jgi:hypothetical protein